MAKIFTLPFILLVISLIYIIFLIIYTFHKKNLSQLRVIFILDLTCVFIICLGVILQTIFTSLFSVPAIYFENFIYIGTCFLPVCVFLTGLIFFLPYY